MASGLRRLVLAVPVEAWVEEPGVVKSFNRVTGAYVVAVRGVDVGPVWSVNQRQHGVGASVTVLMRGSSPQGLVP